MGIISNFYYLKPMASKTRKLSRHDNQALLLG